MSSYEDIKSIEALNIESAVGYRGFVSAFPEMGMEAFLAASERGFMYWGQRIYVAENLQEAQKHHQRLTTQEGCFDPMFVSFYLISDISQSDLEELSHGSNSEITQVFMKEIDSGVFYMRDGEWLRITENVLKGFINLSLLYEDPEEGFFFYQQGWFAPEYRGIIRFDKLENSSTIKNIRKKARAFYRQGYKIHFNKDLALVMKKCGEQERKGQPGGSGSRITDDMINEYMELKKCSKVYSVELENENGEIVSGTFGIVSGGVVESDSIFYPVIQANSGGTLELNRFYGQIDCAKVVVLALIDRLKKAGVDFMDLGMATSFTRNSFKSEYVSRGDYMKLIENSPKIVNIDFKTNWTPNGG